MKQGLQKWVGFFGKSMFWSLLLYVVMMLAVNWDEVSSTFAGKNRITIVNNAVPEPQQPGANPPSPTAANTPRRAGIIKNVMTLVKTISGIAKPAAAI